MGPPVWSEARIELNLDLPKGMHSEFRPAEIVQADVSSTRHSGKASLFERI